MTRGRESEPNDPQDAALNRDYLQTTFRIPSNKDCYFQRLCAKEIMFQVRLNFSGHCQDDSSHSPVEFFQSIFFLSADNLLGKIAPAILFVYSLFTQVHSRPRNPAVRCL
jgi:hypothetical protein